ncbi:hypothetical protein [Rufibacter quisquiliarum]|uniref:Uncharacterized protein n=1 Tax=Rufibacter quisquiliarum TaxID=1549639 RepID=A0A839GGD0_9BACT|nr:hypothetical protein [Rufibacter quisquiliarum]MBA9077932.1 hypothetical protein [Rufibacter quisquiliarum]
MTDKSRGYLPVELPFYDKLNWDMNLIISCLDVFRVQLPIWFENFPKSAEYDLLSFEKPHGPPYPVIGIYCEDDKDFKSLPSFIEIFDNLELKMTKEMIEEVINESKIIKSITWEELKKIGVYTEPVQYK